VLYTDSTHLKANANKGKYDLAMIAKSRSDYWADLDRAIETERTLHGQKPLKEEEREPQVKACEDPLCGDHLSTAETTLLPAQDSSEQHRH